MVDKNLSNWAVSRGFTVSGNQVFGLFRNVWVTVDQSGSYRYFKFSMFSQTPDAVKQLQTALNNYRKTTGALAVTEKDGIVMVTRAGGIKQEVIEAVVNTVVEEAFRLGYSMSTHCINCGQPATTAAMWKGNVQPMCQRCEQEIIDSIENHRDSGAAYFSGVIGALLGAVVGSIPFLLVLMFLNYFVFWLAALVGMGSFLGYRLFRGPRKRWYAHLIVFVCTVVAVLADSIVNIAIALNNSLGAFSFALMSEAMKYSEFANAVYYDVALALVSSIVGYFIMFGMIKSYTVPKKPVRVVSTYQDPSAGYQMPVQQTVPAQSADPAVMGQPVSNGEMQEFTSES